MSPRPIVHAYPYVPDTGWIDISASLPAGLVKSTSNGRCNVKRRGDRVLIDLNVTVSQAGATTIINLPAGYRPDVPLLLPFTFWTATQQNSGLPMTPAVGYMGAGGVSVRPGGPLATGTVMVSLDLLATGPMP